MIGKISARGSRVAGLLYYLYGPGRNEAHTDPHLVAGWRDPAELEPALRQDGRRDFRRLAGLLQQPHAALGPRGFERPVWHCSIRTAPQDRMLSDSEWAQVARDVMHRTGLAPHGQDDEAVRWVALRHASDHIHLVAVLARQDGARPRFWNDYYRVGEACRAAEQRFGLRRTAPRDRTAGSRSTRAESEKARRQGRSEPPRITLRRAVSTAAAASSGEEEFFARLEQAGVVVRKRFSIRNPGQVTGYAVALPADTAGSGTPVWYSGGKLAPDLSLPKLRHRWNGLAAGPAGPSAAPLTQRNGPRSGITWPGRPPELRSRSGSYRPPIRGWRRMPPGQPRTPFTRLPRLWAAGCCARPPTPTPGRPAPRTGAFRAGPRRGRGCAGRPGCCRWPHPPPATPCWPRSR